MIKINIKNDDELKKLVNLKYSDIATQSKENNATSCCGSSCCSTEVYNIMSEDYGELQGYYSEADLGLGCGLPTQFAKIRQGDTVVDLGSGAGNDCFVARAATGENGKVIGVDFSDTMLSKARTNTQKLGFNNIEFRKGEIEKLPITANKADVVVSNCVLNLVPNKKQVFCEIFRILKPKGHFSISDIVLQGNIPHKIQNAAEMYVGCIAGAIQKEEYLSLITTTGFENIIIQKEKPIIIPDDILKNYLNNQEIADFKEKGNVILSITVYAEKPESSNYNCGCSN